MAKERRAGGLKIDLGLNIAALSKGVQNATSELTKLEKNVASIGQNISRGFQAALAVGGVLAVKKLSDAIVQLADKGDSASAIEENFKAMGGESGAIAEARKRVLGVVDSFELMRIANTGLMRDIPGFNQNFGLMAEYGNKLADTMGTETAPAIEQVIDAFAKGKPKQLEAIGVMLNVDKVYSDHAKQLGVNAKQLDDLQKKEAIQLAALKELERINKNRGDLTDSVTQANERLNAAMEEGRIKLGQAINDSPQLARVYNELAKALEDVDWERAGRLAGEFFGIVIALSTKALEHVNHFARGLEYLFGNSLQAEADRTASKITELKENIQELETSWKPGALLDQANGGRIANQLRGQLAQEEGNFKKLNQQIESNAKASEAAATANNKFEVTLKGLTPPIKHTGLGVKALEERQKESAKSAQELEKANNNFGESLRKLLGQSGLPTVASELENIAVQYYKGAISAEEATRQVIELKQAQSDSISTIERFGKQTEESFQKAKDSVDELKDKLKEIEDAKQGGGIFGGLFDNLFGGDGDNKDPELIKKGRKIGEILSDGIAEGLSQGIEIALSGGKGADYRAALSQTLFNGLAQAANSELPGSGAFVQALEPLFAKSLEKIFGGEHAGTTARKSADKFFADAFDANRLAIIVNGELVQIKDLVFKGETLFGGNSQFGDGSFSGFFNSLEGDARRAFAGVGAAFEELLGVGEDISGQIAAVLANNIGGELNNLQLLVMRSGKSFEELKDGILSAFENQKLSALEAQSALAGIQQISEKGIPGAMGDIQQAWENFVAAGPKGGIVLIDAIQDIGHEAKKINLDLKAVQDQLIASGKYDSEAINQAFDALKATGITTIEKLTQATTADLLPALAKLENEKFPFAEASAKLEDISKKLEGIDSHLEKELTIKVKTEFDANTQEALQSGAFEGTQIQNALGTQKFATGAILNRATFIRPNAIAGEAGPEGILPLGNVNGKLGVYSKGGGSHGNITVNVYAQNSERGVHEDILAALEENVVNRTINVLLDGIQRGSYGGVL